MPVKLKFKKIIYPLISGIIAIIIIIVFIYSVKFLAEAIDRVFAQDTEFLESHLIRLDMEKFNLVAKKLGINQQPTTYDLQPTIDNLQQTATSSQSLVVGSQLSLDKTAVKIKVINSTKTRGLAKELKTILEADGFLVNEMDTISPALATTTIKIKESKKNYNPLVRESVSKKYPEAEDKVLEEKENFDIIIIIGSK